MFGLKRFHLLEVGDGDDKFKFHTIAYNMQSDTFSRFKSLTTQQNVFCCESLSLPTLYVDN